MNTGAAIMGRMNMGTAITIITMITIMADIGIAGITIGIDAGGAGRVPLHPVGSFVAGFVICQQGQFRLNICFR